jgi:P2-related tail formation protein
MPVVLIVKSIVLNSHQCPSYFLPFPFVSFYVVCWNHVVTDERRTAVSGKLISVEFFGQNHGCPA